MRLMLKPTEVVNGNGLYPSEWIYYKDQNNELQYTDDALNLIDKCSVNGQRYGFDFGYTDKYGNDCALFTRID